MKIAIRDEHANLLGEWDGNYSVILSQSEQDNQNAIVIASYYSGTDRMIIDLAKTPKIIDRDYLGTFWIGGYNGEHETLWKPETVLHPA